MAAKFAIIEAPSEIPFWRHNYTERLASQASISPPYNTTPWWHRAILIELEVQSRDLASLQHTTFDDEQGAILGGAYGKSTSAFNT